MSMRLAIIPPPKIVEAIKQAISPYREYIEHVAPHHTWHIPLMEISDIPATEPLRQSFHQTIRLLSIGAGKEPGQLWARVQSTPALQSLRESVRTHISTRTSSTPQLEKIIPHIYLGSFTHIPAFGIVDTPLPLTFSITAIHAIKTDPYEILSSIAIVS